LLSQALINLLKDENRYRRYSGLAIRV